jgi:hypothetical protein
VEVVGYILVRLFKLTSYFKKCVTSFDRSYRYIIHHFFLQLIFEAIRHTFYINIHNVVFVRCKVDFSTKKEDPKNKGWTKKVSKGNKKYIALADQRLQRT